MTSFVRLVTLLVTPIDFMPPLNADLFPRLNQSRKKIAAKIASVNGPLGFVSYRHIIF